MHPIDGSVYSGYPRSHTAANVAAMGNFDWIALVFATVVIGFAVIGELKDIELCNVGERSNGRLGCDFAGL